MGFPYRVEKLRRDHRRAAFSSGDPALDRFFKYEKRRHGRLRLGGH